MYAAVDVSSSLQQKLNDLRMTVNGCMVEGSQAVAVDDVVAGSGLENDLDGIEIARFGADEQHRVVAERAIGVEAARYQIPHRGNIIGDCCSHKGIWILVEAVAARRWVEGDCLSGLSSAG